VTELTELVVTLGRHSGLVLVARSANVAAVAFLLELGAAIFDVVAILSAY